MTDRERRKADLLARMARLTGDRLRDARRGALDAVRALEAGGDGEALDRARLELECADAELANRAGGGLPS